MFVVLAIIIVPVYACGMIIIIYVAGWLAVDIIIIIMRGTCK